MDDIRLKPCPFCGCSMRVEHREYPNGSHYWEPSGWHDDNCPLDAVLWCMHGEDGWDGQKVAEAWNWRFEEP